MTHLFQPWRLGALELANRIVIAPMCQYSATDGQATDWHMIHLGHLALSGAGLLILEATAVSAVGRITSGDLGLYSAADEAALATVLAAIRANAPIAIAIQLSHAGRKGSCRVPWEGGTQLRPDEPGGWHAEAPSALPHAPAEVAPMALDATGLDRVRRDFVAATERAARLGIDGIELHGAHGYLLHQFLSPLANQRDDQYGGSPENRMRFPLEVFEGGWDIEQTIAFSHALKARGCAAIHVSSGGVSPLQKISLGPGYQVALARRVKEAVGLPTIAVGLITEPSQAETIVASGDADAVALARGILYDPRWPWHAAAALGAHVSAPKQYRRSPPREFATLFDGMVTGQR